MKRKFRMLMSFLGLLKKGNIKIEWNLYDDVFQWEWPHIHGDTTLPQNIIDLIVDVIVSKKEEIFDFYNNCYSETEYYRIVVEINPKEKKILVTMEAEQYAYESNTYKRQIENPDLEDFFKRTGTNVITANYSGSGDSGDIEDIKINGELDNRINWSSREPDTKLIWDLLYDNLENAYGGWEIDDGSSGNIKINDNMEIIISHEWNSREMELCNGEFELKEEDLKE